MGAESNRELWVNRKFDFGKTPDQYEALLERLRATPARVEAMVTAYPQSFLTQESDQRWSIQRNIGHLTDLDALLEGRLDDFAAGSATLRSADRSNQITQEAPHDDRSSADLLKAFRVRRAELMFKLEDFDRSLLMITARHPRLRVDVNAVDMVYFHAEHDDHHLARVKELLDSV